jgi:hypothetical protein
MLRHATDAGIDLTRDELRSCAQLLMLPTDLDEGGSVSVDVIQCACHALFLLARKPSHRETLTVLQIRQPKETKAEGTADTVEGDVVLPTPNALSPGKKSKKHASSDAFATSMATKLGR